MGLVLKMLGEARPALKNRDATKLAIGVKLLCSL